MLWLFWGKEFHVPSFRRKSDKKEIGGLGKGEEEGFYGGGGTINSNSRQHGFERTKEVQDGR